MPAEEGTHATMATLESRDNQSLGEEQRRLLSLEAELLVEQDGEAEDQTISCRNEGQWFSLEMSMD